jgi:hypothetical protein
LSYVSPFRPSQRDAPARFSRMASFSRFVSNCWGFTDYKSPLLFDFLFIFCLICICKHNNYMSISIPVYVVSLVCFISSFHIHLLSTCVALAGRFLFCLYAWCVLACYTMITHIFCDSLSLSTDHQS